MTQNKRHILNDFMEDVTREMSSEYERIQKYAVEDPGTAGDQGEENWAALLREWLPQHYRVVTKGRLINEKGARSPQVDIIVLKPSYPAKLVSVKHYLLSGVAAVFECKTTLKKKDIDEAVETCAEVKSMFTTWNGTPYEELHAPVIFGLLAHAHSWKKSDIDNTVTIKKHLIKAVTTHADHPRLEIDLLCVANLVNWVHSTYLQIGDYSHLSRGSTVSEIKKYEANASEDSEREAVFTSYDGHIHMDGQEGGYLGSKHQVGAFIIALYSKLAWKDVVSRDFVQYFRVALKDTHASFEPREWPSSVLSDEAKKMYASRTMPRGGWSEWRGVF